MGTTRPHATRRAVRRAVVAGAVVLALGALGACGGDDDTDAGGAGDVPITISGFAFTVTDPVAAGGNIEIVNRDAATHTVTADDGAFDARVPGSATAEITAPDEPGRYAFHCEIHPQMTAELVVE